VAGSEWLEPPFPTWGNGGLGVAGVVVRTPIDRAFLTLSRHSHLSLACCWFASKSVSGYDSFGIRVL
jgi:hypothetical protein